jgi:hypothetical protein
MTHNADELANAYAGAWNERDRGRRMELLRSCCEEDVRFIQDGIGVINGIDGLDDLIGQFWGGQGEGVHVEITSKVQEHNGFGRGSFVWVHPDARFTGTDFVELGPNERMKTIVVFMDEE